MRSDDEVGKVAAVSPILISKALELFIASLVSTAKAVALEKHSKKLSNSHIKTAVLQESRFDFLKDLVSHVQDPTESDTKPRKKRTKTSHEDLHVKPEDEDLLDLIKEDEMKDECLIKEDEIKPSLQYPHDDLIKPNPQYPHDDVVKPNPQYPHDDIHEVRDKGDLNLEDKDLQEVRPVLEYSQVQLLPVVFNETNQDVEDYD